MQTVYNVTVHACNVGLPFLKTYIIEMKLNDNVYICEMHFVENLTKTLTKCDIYFCIKIMRVKNYRYCSLRCFWNERNQIICVE